MSRNFDLGITNRKLEFLTEAEDSLFWYRIIESNNNGVIDISDCFQELVYFLDIFFGRPEGGPQWK